MSTLGPRSDKEVVVYLVPIGKISFLPPAEHALMNQKALEFVPHVLVVQKGTTIDFLNGDNFTHDVSSHSGCCSFDLGLFEKGESRSHIFEKAGVAVLSCSLHPDMEAYVVVVDTPYFEAVELAPGNGRQTANFSLKGLPPGKYKLLTWSKKLTSKEKIVVIQNNKTAQFGIDLFPK